MKRLACRCQRDSATRTFRQAQLLLLFFYNGKGQNISKILYFFEKIWCISIAFYFLVHFSSWMPSFRLTEVNHSTTNYFAARFLTLNTEKLWFRASTTKILFNKSLILSCDTVPLKKAETTLMYFCPSLLYARNPLATPGTGIWKIYILYNKLYCLAEGLNGQIPHKETWSSKGGGAQRQCG